MGSAFNHDLMNGNLQRAHDLKLMKWTYHTPGIWCPVTGAQYI